MLPRKQPLCSKLAAVCKQVVTCGNKPSGSFDESTRTRILLSAGLLLHLVLKFRSRVVSRQFNVQGGIGFPFLNQKGNSGPGEF